MQTLNEKDLSFIKENIQTNYDFLTTLGKIPAPSHQEDKRAEFCKAYMESLGATNVRIDAAKNVVCEIDCEGKDQVVIFAAHTDIVFPDLDELPMKIDGDRIAAPGIGDDTGNLANLMMGLKYVLETPGSCPYGLVIVANSCEEGLGNLDGTRELVKTYGDRMKAFISFDGYCPQCCSRAVGSHRYEITIRAQGGHSYANFGNTSAIKFAADVIQRLYAQEMPGGDKTTFNVGTIQGGTTVNTIPEKCVILYEFRSESQDNLMFMANQVQAIIAEFKEGGMDIEIKTLGIRPGNRAVPPTGIEEMTARNAEILSQFWEGPLDFNAYSTDANIPLSLGIPSNVIGTIRGGGAHTYDEWIDFSFQETGMKIAISLLKEYWK